MNISIQVCQLLALCLVMTAADGIRIRIRGRRPRPFRHGRPRRPVPVFLAVPGGQTVPVFPLGGPAHEQSSEPAAPEPHTPTPLPLAPAHPPPAQPAGPAEPAEPTELKPTEPALQRPAAPASSAFDNFDEDFFDESGPFGGSLPPFPDISSIFADAGRRSDSSAPAAGQQWPVESRTASISSTAALRRLDSAWEDSDSDSGWPTHGSEAEYADLYYRASSPNL